MQIFGGELRKYVGWTFLSDLVLTGKNAHRTPKSYPDRALDCTTESAGTAQTRVSRCETLSAGQMSILQRSHDDRFRGGHGKKALVDATYAA